jgi:YggT family protein
MAYLVAAVRIYSYLLLARVLFSWLPPRHREGEFYAFLVRITEPVLAPIRRCIPRTGPVDFSPLILFILLALLASLLTSM